jgi:hypothetical protein
MVKKYFLVFYNFDRVNYNIVTAAGECSLMLQPKYLLYDKKQSAALEYCGCPRRISFWL